VRLDQRQRTVGSHLRTDNAGQIALKRDFVDDRQAVFRRNQTQRAFKALGFRFGPVKLVTNGGRQFGNVIVGAVPNSASRTASSALSNR